MKKKTFKLNESQLRNLILEAIKSRAPGSPLWSPPCLTEAVVVDNVASEVYDEMHRTMYDINLDHLESVLSASDVELPVRHEDIEHFADAISKQVSQMLLSDVKSVVTNLLRSLMVPK